MVPSNVLSMSIYPAMNQGFHSIMSTWSGCFDTVLNAFSRRFRRVVKRILENLYSKID